jgi:DNA repair protein RecO (recombination protein O)
LIVTWLTSEAGRLKTVAKGARQVKSRFSGMLDLFYLCEIQISRSRKSDLHILREAVLKDPFPGIRLDYERVNLAGYFVELLEMVTESDHSAPELFDLLVRALNFLNTKAPTRRAMEHFEDELCRALGILQNGVSSAQTLRTTYHELPAARKALLQSLH